MIRSGTMCGVLFLAIICTGASLPEASEGRPPRTSLRTVEGEVQAIARASGEGGLELVQVRLVMENDHENALMVLLAPSEVMTSIGLEIKVGDRIRVKYYSDESGRAMAHKVRNQSRGTMVRLRTVRQLPLWDSRGEWHGGPCRTRTGGGGGPGGGGSGGPGGRN